MRLFKRKSFVKSVRTSGIDEDNNVHRVYATNKTFRGRRIFLSRDKRDNNGDEILLMSSFARHLRDEL